MNVEQKKQEPAFDIEKFLTISRQLDLTGLDLEDAKKYGLNGSEVRVIRYMQDTELYTVHYMKALMETSALADEEARSFLVNWGYEECYHGRTLAKILSICGHEPSKKSVEEFARPRKWTEVLQDIGGRALSMISDDFIAVHMSWGAINELTACNAYTRMAELSDNPILAEVCRRIVKDERRHYAFYYQQAQRRLKAPLARKMAGIALKALWEPVGGSMQPREARDFVGAYLFGDAAGRACLRDIDARIAQLQGLEWFDLVSKHTNAGTDRIRAAGIFVDEPKKTHS